MSGRGRRRLVAAGLWLALAGLYLAWSARQGLEPLSGAPLRRLLELVAATPGGALLFVLLYALRPLLLLSAALLSIAAGALFGPVLGVLLVVIGSNLGAALAYGLARLFGGEGPALAVGADGAGGLARRWLARLRARSFETVFLMRLLYLPYDLVNVLAGLLRVHFGAFLLATALGSLPGTLAFTLAGASTGGVARPAFDPRVLAASAALFLASLALARWLRRREARRPGGGAGRRPGHA